MRRISEAGLDLIKNFEGCRLKAYKPVAAEKYWTIGYGHYGPDVKQSMTITQKQADEMLASDMGKYEAYVNSKSYVPVIEDLNQNQFDTLVSFCYNCGNGNLRKLCNDRTIEQIAASIPKYTRGANGEVLKGLVNRRAAEVELFNKPVSSNKEDETMDKVNVVVNGKTITDVKMMDGKTYVPLRAVGEAWGAQVDWNDKTNTATVSK